MNLIGNISLGELFQNIQQNSISFTELIVALILATFVGFFIFMIYKYSFSQTAYSYTFNIALILMVLITAIIIITLGSNNIILSLGMVGTLSVVRFRSTLKDPIDIVYILWATAAGLAIGAQQYMVSVVGSVVIGIIILALTLFKLSVKTFILVANYPKNLDSDVASIIDQRNVKLKSKIVKKEMVELTLEVTKGYQAIMESLEEVVGIEQLSLISFED